MRRRLFCVSDRVRFFKAQTPKTHGTSPDTSYTHLTGLGTHRPKTSDFLPVSLTTPNGLESLNGQRPVEKDT